MEPAREPTLLGYQFGHEEDARAAASDLDRRFSGDELAGLRIYRVRWNGDFLVEAAFPPGTPQPRLQDAGALLGEAGTPVHPDDLADYKNATKRGPRGLESWVRRLFGG